MWGDITEGVLEEFTDRAAFQIDAKDVEAGRLRITGTEFLGLLAGSFEQKCGKCGKNYTAYTSRSEYCSDRCRSEVQYDKVAKTAARAPHCGHCGSALYTGRRNKEYCGKQCRSAAYRERVRATH